MLFLILGKFQFGRHTTVFFLGFFYYNETLDVHKLISFIFIWVAVIIYLNELRKEWKNKINRGTISEAIKEINNKFIFINGLKKSKEIKFPTKILFWKFSLGKKSNPEISPHIIDIAASFESIFTLKKP